MSVDMYVSVSVGGRTVDLNLLHRSATTIVEHSYDVEGLALRVA
jgi:hypothetical protein